MQILDKILKEIDAEIEKQKETDGSLVGTSMWNQWVKGMQRAKDIIRGHVNDGWISVEEALPEDDNDVITTQGFASGALYVGIDVYDSDYGWESGADEDIIAWQPLPQAYKPGRSEA